MTAWRAQVSGRSTAAVIPDAERAYRSRWRHGPSSDLGSPLALLPDVSQVPVVPDGVINLVSFAALPDRHEPLLDRRCPLIHYLFDRALHHREGLSGSPDAGMLAVWRAAHDDRTKTAGAAGALREGCATIGGRTSITFRAPAGRRDTRRSGQWALMAPATRGPLAVAWHQRPR